jgi:hypothetical protein
MYRVTFQVKGQATECQIWRVNLSFLAAWQEVMPQKSDSFALQYI